MEKIGLLAGNGQFPVLFAQAAKQMGFYVAAVGFEGETVPELAQEVDSLNWIKLGQLGKLISSLKKENITKASMCGGITKIRMFKDIKLDFKAISYLPRLKHLADDGILKVLAKILEEEGIKILPSHELLPGLLAVTGNYTKRKPTLEEIADIDLGWQIFDKLGPLDIGQALVLKNKVVVAVEAIEGTDACILRAGELSGPGAVIVKRCKPNQDLRFDLPAIGVKTIETMLKAGAACLCIEAGKTLSFDKKAMVDLADLHNICILAR